MPIVRVWASAITASVYCYAEDNYAGSAPMMIIRQPGQAAITATGTPEITGWYAIATAFTPAALPPYVFVEFCNNNTAVGSTAYATYFDKFTVS
jgi:hypothetical protein